MEEMAWERTDTRIQPRLKKWWAFKERDWMHPDKSAESPTPNYQGISQRTNLKRPRSPEVSISEDDILMIDSWLNGIQEPGASDTHPNGNNMDEDPQSRKRKRFPEPQDQPSLVQQVVDRDEIDDNYEDKENIYPITKLVNNRVVLGEKRKRKPLGIRQNEGQNEGYLDIFSKVNAANSSHKKRINTQWKVLDDRVNRTLRHFRGYHREQIDWEYEMY